MNYLQLTGKEVGNASKELVGTSQLLSSILALQAVSDSVNKKNTL